MSEPQQLPNGFRFAGRIFGIKGGAHTRKVRLSVVHEATQAHKELYHR